MRKNTKWCRKAALGPSPQKSAIDYLIDALRTRFTVS
jgi:hypothetical protein